MRRGEQYTKGRFSCESTKDGKPCGNCPKCDEINDAKKSWMYKRAER